MMIKSVRLSELTLGEAEELRKAGAVLNMSPDGKISICAEKSALHPVKGWPEGDGGIEGDAGHGRR